MFKRYFIPNLIGLCKQQQYHLALIGLLIFMVGYQNVYRPTTDSPRRLCYL